MSKSRATARTVRACKILFMAGALCLVGQKGATPRIQLLDLQQSEIIGSLLHSLGDYVTVEGDYFGKPGMQRSGLEVDRIVGSELNKSWKVTITVDDRNLAKPLEAGKRYKLRGFETGSFAGMPDDPENPPSPEALRLRQSAGPNQRLQFQPVFVVTKAEEIGAVKQ